MIRKHMIVLEEMQRNLKEQVKCDNSNKGMKYYLVLTRAINELKYQKFSFGYGFLLGIGITALIGYLVR